MDNFITRRGFTALAVNLTMTAQAMARQNNPPATKTILVLGDSLSAEYGLVRGTGWVALLERQLVAEKITATVRNASISGETTAGGRSRFAALLQSVRPTHVIVELGANDALRGLALTQTQDNLMAICQAAQKANAKVLLVGMQMPPNYGADYALKYAKMYRQVAQSTHAALVPFFLKGVADQADALALFQADHIHPLAAAHPTLLANIWGELKKQLR